MNDQQVSDWSDRSREAGGLPSAPNAVIERLELWIAELRRQAPPGSSECVDGLENVLAEIRSELGRLPD